MKKPEAVARRLLTAIEELVARETVALIPGNCAGAAAAALRAAPLIARLSEICTADSTAGAAVVRRVEALLEKRRQNQARLAARRIFLEGEMRRIAAARLRLRALAPTYGRNYATARRVTKLQAAV